VERKEEYEEKSDEKVKEKERGNYNKGGKLRLVGSSAVKEKKKKLVLCCVYTKERILGK